VGIGDGFLSGAKEGLLKINTFCSASRRRVTYPVFDIAATLPRRRGFDGWLGFCSTAGGSESASAGSTFWRFVGLRGCSAVTARAGSGLEKSRPRVLRFRVDEVAAGGSPGGLEPALSRAAAERVTLGDMRNLRVQFEAACFRQFGAEWQQGSRSLTASGQVRL
jgi:hypothetical protein